MPLTGKNEGSASITDGYAHTATGSAGDTMEYQIVSTLPTITSQATALSTYNFYDTLCEGLTYSKDAGVTIEFFTDAACTDKAASWNKDSGKFTVTYSEDGRHMTVDIAKAGLAEINGATANKNGKLYTGYSNYTARVTYSAVINADKTFVYGEKGNENTVILTWKRTSGDYYDTLIDDCHVFSFGLDLTKLFSDVDAETAAETKLYDSVKFKIQNKTDGTWIIAKRNDEEGVYYVTGHTDKEADATVFTPVTMGKAVAYQHGTDPLSVAAVSINLEKLKQAVPEDADTGDYVVLTEDEVYDFMRKKAQENNQNQNSNKHQEVTYEKHYPQHHSSHHPSDF